MDLYDGEELQEKLSDRSINPLLQDISRLYNKWRVSEYGSSSNGKDLAESLTEEVNEYNRNNAACGGKASVQIYDAGGDSADTESDSDAESRPPKP